MKLDQMLGASAPVTVEYDSGGGAFLDGRYRNSGRMRAGDYINSDRYVQEGIQTGDRAPRGLEPRNRGTSRMAKNSCGCFSSPPVIAPPKSTRKYGARSTTERANSHSQTQERPKWVGLRAPLFSVWTNTEACALIGRRFESSKGGSCPRGYGDGAVMSCLRSRLGGLEKATPFVFPGRYQRPLPAGRSSRAR